MVREPEHMLIGGEWREAADGRWIEILDPATGAVIGQLARGGEKDVAAAVTAARTAFESRSWRDMAPSRRGQLLQRMGELVRRHAEELARLEVLDTGKAISVARADVALAANYYEYYGGFADKIQGETIPVNATHLTYTMREPRGVCAIIAPWNFPIQTSSRGLAPALAAGNAVVMKPAEEACLTPLRLGELATEAGFPPGIVNIVPGIGEEAGAALARHPDINHITFTGSVETGVAVMRAAAGNVVPVVLELGGKGPHIVFDDARLDAALPIVARAAFRVSGQSCSSGSRLIIHERVAAEFVEQLAAQVPTLRVGRGDDDPDLGPLISKRQQDRVQNYIAIGQEEGAHMLARGNLPADQALQQGFFVAPTIFDRVTPNLRIFQEEIFGPVLVVTTFADEEEAVHLANNTPYGLVAGVWTESLGRAHRVARQIQAGNIYVNNWASGTGIATPFGGYKKSGIGREKGLETFHHYTQSKAVSIFIG
jgi:acyl-CoA reductase-like NAD-dependent aldehyde dehydrogenase